MESADVRRRRVERLEREFDAAPGRYRLKLGLLAALGYGVLGASLLLTLVLAIVLVVYCLIRPPEDGLIVIPILSLGAIGLVVLRALWIRFEAPAGYALAAGEAPALRGEVERIRRDVGAQRLHGIVIDDQLNAAAAFVPAGIGLWHQRHYLVLGLPLLRLLDGAEMAAVIAHEFGHFNQQHGRFSAWIYRLRVSWYRVLEGLSGPGMASQHLFWRFFRWYAPYFDVRSFVLARRQEYAADGVAAAVVGAEPMARALARLGLASDWLSETFWPEVERSAHAQAFPPVHVHARLGQGLAQERLRHERIPRWLLAHRPAPEDTHPGLRQRLTALGCSEEIRLQSAPLSAAESWLDAGLLDRLEQRFSRDWQSRAKADWEARHHTLAEEGRRLDLLDGLPQRNPAEWLEYAALIETHRPATDAVPLYREGLRHLPAHAVGQCRLGVLLLRQGQEEAGLEHMQQAMRLDRGLIAQVLHQLDLHLRSQPETSRLHAVARKLRSDFGDAGDRLDGQEAGTDLQAHDLDEGQAQAVRRALAGFDRIAAAWVLRQPAPGLSLSPHYLVLVEWTGSVASEQAALPRLAGRLALPGTFELLSSSGRGPLLRRARAVIGAGIYRRR